MAKKETTVTNEKSSSPQNARMVPPPNTGSGSGVNPLGSKSDLEDLREIFWGNHIRATENRFDNLEADLDRVNRTLAESFNEKLTSLAELSKTRLHTTQERLAEQLASQSKQSDQSIQNLKLELNQRLDRQTDNHGNEIRKTQRELMAYVDEQSAVQAANLRQAQQEMNERLDKLATDLLTQLGQARKELSQQITRLGDDQTQRLNNVRSEAQKRDEDLRQEMLKLTTALEDKSAARHDLGQLYMELGRRLYHG